MAVCCARTCSVRDARRSGHMAAGRHTLLVGFEFDAQTVVEDPQVAVAPAYYGVRHNRLHFLGDHADIGPVASVVAETVKADAIGKMPQKNDVVLEGDV